MKLKINKRDFVRQIMTAMRPNVRQFNKLGSQRLVFVLTAIEKYARQNSIDALLSFADIAYAIKLAHGHCQLSEHAEEALRGMSVRKLVALVYDLHKGGVTGVIARLNLQFASVAKIVVLADYLKAA